LLLRIVCSCGRVDSAWCSLPDPNFLALPLLRDLLLRAKHLFVAAISK
jgi:hypothetical protein